MSYCINPKCTHRQNPDPLTDCQSCGSPVLVNDRYRIVRPLREPNPAYPTDLYEVKDWGNGDDNWGTLKVMKVLKFSNNPDFVRLFKREARVLMWLRHQGIPKVEPDGYFTLTLPRNKQLHCLVMEKIEGDNLEQWLEQHRPLSQEDALDWLEQLGYILDTLHQKNLFHRDIKPSNLILRPNGQLALIDFGTVGEEDSGSTRVGTSGYAAPEQIIGEAKPQSDFFALGRTFVHLVTGLPPMDFPEGHTGELLWRNVAPQISPILANFIDELMAPGYEHRPRHTRDLFNRLKEVQRDLHAPQPPRKFWNFKIVALLLAGSIAFSFVFPPIVWSIENYLSPQMANFLTTIAIDRLENYRDESAEFYLKWAINIYPEYGNAQYNLGRVCEEQKEWFCASEAYQKAIASDDKKAIVYAIDNLARLHIFREGDYSQAVKEIHHGLELAKEVKNLQPAAISDLHKNLGWAYFKQKNYEKAEATLRSAIALDAGNTSAYCLLAQVLEAQEKNSIALQAWQQCLDLPSAYKPETEYWKTMARDRLEVVQHDR